MDTLWTPFHSWSKKFLNSPKLSHIAKSWHQLIQRVLKVKPLRIHCLLSSTSKSTELKRIEKLLYFCLLSTSTLSAFWMFSNTHSSMAFPWFENHQPVNTLYLGGPRIFLVVYSSLRKCCYSVGFLGRRMFICLIGHFHRNGGDRYSNAKDKPPFWGKIG